MKSIYKLLCTLAILCTVQTILPMGRHIAQKMAGPLHRGLHFTAKRFKSTSKDIGSRLGPYRPGPHRKFTPKDPKSRFQQQFKNQSFKKKHLRSGPQFKSQQAVVSNEIIMPNYAKQVGPKGFTRQILELPKHMYEATETPGPMARLRSWWYGSAKPQVQNMITGARRWGHNVIHQTKKRLSPITEKEVGKLRAKLHSIMQRASLTSDERERLLKELEELSAKKIRNLRQKEILYNLTAIVGSAGIVTGGAILLKELKQHFVGLLRTEIISAIEILYERGAISLDQVQVLEQARKEMTNKGISMKNQNYILIELIKQTRAQQLEPTEIEQLYNKLESEYFAQFERRNKQAKIAEKQMESFGSPY